MSTSATRLSSVNIAGQQIDWPPLDAVLDLALQEDLQGGDLTSLATIKAETKLRAKVVYKQKAVVAGLFVFKRLMQKLDAQIGFEVLVDDGQVVNPVPQTAAVLEGSARAILAGERTALNFLQRLSGIATITSAYVQKAKTAGIDILDTRKTTPVLRAFEKMAVRLGGGCNHRFGLYDAVLIKDNHLQLADGVKAAVQSAKQKYPQEKIEVEVESLAQLQEALAAGVDTVLLDNMTPAQVAQAVKTAAGQCRIEVSGGINLNNLDDYLIPGVNAISVGALTHSAPSIDISLDVEG